MSITIRELMPDEMPRMLPLIAAWNTHITLDVLADRLPEMLALGYRCIGAFDGEEIVGIAGFWVGCRFWCGRYLDVDNVIVAEDRRDKGIGGLLMRWVHAEADRLECDVTVLDSYVDNVGSHTFYKRLGYEPLGYHFVRGFGTRR